MAFSLTGGKNKSKTSETAKFDQTQTNSLSPRAAGLLSGGIADLKGQAYSPLDFGRVQQFQDPYAEDVRDATMAQLNQSRAVAQNAQKAEWGKASAFGDDRRGIYEATLDGEHDRTAASTLAGLNSAGFAQALSAAMQENQGRNDFDLGTQELVTRLLSMFGQEGTTHSAGTSSGTGKSSGTNLGFSFSPFGPQGK